MFLVYQIKMLYYAGRIAGILTFATGGYVYKQHHENRALAMMIIKQQEENDILSKRLHDEIERSKKAAVRAEEEITYINIGLAVGSFIGATYMLLRLY
jgi:hypothetical protein